MKKRLQFEKYDRAGVPLAELIAVHRQFHSPSALANNIGDGFLYATNPIFRSIRDKCLSLKFTFSLKDPCNYFAFPLMSLDDIMALGTIPYRDNFSWLEILAQKAPRLTLTELKKSELQFNYLFHESAHFIAHSTYFGKRTWDIPKDSDSILKILLEESFANTMESLSALFVTGEIENYFLDANCHFRLNQKEVRTVQKAVDRWGSKSVSIAMMASFLYANFMYEKLGTREQSLIKQLAGIKKGEMAPLLRIALLLSKTFRTNTTQLHLIKVGFSADLGKMMAYDPVQRLSSDASLRKKFMSLVDLLGWGNEG